LPATVELLLGGRDAAAVAAQLKSFHGVLVDELAAAESELARISETAAAERRGKVDPGQEFIE
jgi:hypothetical protein